jgi:hypothetical protein
MFALTSCFEKDEALAPSQWDGQGFAFSESIYTSQFYYSLSSNSIRAKNNNEAWDLSFEASANGWHIRINSANLLGVRNTHSLNFDQTSFPSSSNKWMYDKSDGNPDSTAIGKWVDTSGVSNTYTNEVYLIGKYDGIDYLPIKKIVFTMVNDTSYQLKYADLNGDNFHQLAIKKDASYNQVYYSFTSHSPVSVEPARNSWDLLFTQYTTTLYTDQGVAIPYFVRGVLINPYHVEAILDSVHTFSSITLSLTSTMVFSQKQDVIGHDWKSVEIDQQANTAKYAVREKYTFIIRDVGGVLYKLKFTSFFNDSRTPGYPSFIFLKLE